MKSRLTRYIILTVLAVAALAIAVFVIRPGLLSRLSRLTDTDTTSGLHVEVEREQFPVKGIDISHHNGDIDFRRVIADSVDFVIIKASEGATFRDSCLAEYYDGAKAAGLRTGFYHFFRFERGGVRQGRNFLEAIGDRHADLPLVIDFESANNPETDYYLVVGRLRDMADFLRRHGHRIMVYCNHTEYEKYIRHNFDDIDLWLASGRLPDDDDRRHLWQHSHNGHVDGIPTPVDINTFNGTRAEFEEWLAIPAPQPLIPDAIRYNTDSDSLIKDSLRITAGSPATTHIQ